MDPLLECAVPKGPLLSLLLQMKPGAALVCAFCHERIGFDDRGDLVVASDDWPEVRYSRASLEDKKVADGAPTTMNLEDWAKAYRFQKPGTAEPLENYPYAP